MYRGGKKVNIGFSDFGTGSSNQLRDPRVEWNNIDLKRGLVL
jgi:hypothetical protein